MPSDIRIIQPGKAMERNARLLQEAEDRERELGVAVQLQRVAQLILYYCDRYNATEELLSLDDINIEALTALIEKYQVLAEDKSAIMTQVLMIVLDLMGKLDETWYTIWNTRVKPALNSILQQRKAE